MDRRGFLTPPNIAPRHEAGLESPAYPKGNGNCRTASDRQAGVLEARVSDAGLESGFMKQYDDLKATYLYCNTCGGSMPVRERLLLILPDGYLFEYFCVRCGDVVGDKKTKLRDKDRMLLQ